MDRILPFRFSTMILSIRTFSLSKISASKKVSLSLILPTRRSSAAKYSSRIFRASCADLTAFLAPYQPRRGPGQ